MEGLQDAIEQELNAQNTDGTQQPGAEEQQPPAQPAGEQPPAPAPEADPDIDIGGTKVKKSVLEAFDIDLEGGKKVKLADLRKGFMLNEDYTKKTQELSAERQKNKELLDWASLVVKNPKFANILATLTDKGITNTGFNEALLDKVLAALDDKQQAAAAKSDELEEALKNMDPLDPNYEVFKQALEKNRALEQRLSGLEQKIQGTEAQTLKHAQETEKQARDQAIQQAQTRITSALDALVDPAKPDSLKFFTPEEKALWRKEVLFVLAHNPREIKSEEDFNALIKDVGAQVHGHLNKMFEARLAEYLKTKKGPSLPPAAPGNQPPAAQNKPLSEQTTLQDKITSELEAAMQEREQ